MKLDRDLESIQMIRELIVRARTAQKALAEFDQERVDRLVAAMAAAAERAAEPLARLAREETGFGVYEDKVAKNLFAAQRVYEYIRPLRTVGIISEDRKAGVLEVAAPAGVIAGIVPSTNPTSTVIFKALIAIKARNAIVFSPHPAAARCSQEAAAILAAGAVAAGGPEGLIGCTSLPTMEATRELMHHPDVALILATGGGGLVRAAYGSGKPAFGVGPGNVPAFVERTADIQQAVHDIMVSKTFDNGTICASEQAVVADLPVRDQVMAELQRQGARFVNPDECRALERTVVKPGGGINPAIVGQSATTIAGMAGLDVASGTRVLVAELDGVGREHPLSMEKLSPILAFYAEDGWRAACGRCMEILAFGGLGHSLVIHSRDEDIIQAFGLEKPASRILVNTPAAQGAIGLTTDLAPSLTLGCGTLGGNITGDNVTPMHLLNVKRVAYGVRPAAPGPANGRTGGPKASFSPTEVREIVHEVLRRLG